MEILIDRLNQEIEEAIVSTENSWSKRFSNAAKQVTRSLELVEKAAKSLADASKRAWGSISRPTEKYAVRLSDQIASLCEEAVDASDTSYDAVKHFQEKSVETAKSITRIYNKYAPSIVRSLKPETSKLEDSINSLNRNVAALSQLLDDSKLREIETVARDAKVLLQETSRLHCLMTEKAQALEALRKLKEREVNLESALSALNRDSGLAELNQIEEKIREKETEALALFEPLSKPLRKIDRPEVKLPPSLNKASVDRLTQNPLDALLGLSVVDMNEMLVSLHRMIDDDLILLEYRKKRKTLEAIDVLRAGALEKLREDHDILQANRQEILRQLKGSGLHGQWLDLKNQIEIAHSEAAKCRSHVTNLESQERQQRSLVFERKVPLEKRLQDALGDRISILIPF